jgi:hypothetical protein
MTQDTNRHVLVVVLVGDSVAERISRIPSLKSILSLITRDRPVQPLVQNGKDLPLIISKSTVLLLLLTIIITFPLVLALLVALIVPVLLVRAQPLLGWGT